VGSMGFLPEHVQDAIDHLRAQDPVLRRLIGDVGPFTLTLERNRFAMLVRSIISQQISTSAARSIRQRLDRLVAPGRASAEKLASLSPEQLRSAGISPQKARYLHDLARKTLDGTLRLRQLGRMTDEKIIEELVQVKGIGRWSGQMRNLYALDSLPNKETALAIAQPWRPYATVASWYCWRSLDRQGPPRRNGTGYPA
jgi:DNA-3-methyladenine glycosylase II